ncbi:hypothetical protein [Candidatus Reidiella endopervernicosa]|uniref:Uncharacterized protein n=1 Tax=Candidatus Reidiella endopervernicosa TaxID=2738883 RepID=A0A6N0HRE5_9GAMM|nr:hypothetical protein [Candidatus Reidiella endopervernicosa]QKQ24989.1 hypothetical protein HUE57_00830 [Candidatus Reidiella endopervernicosa]
MSYEQHNPWCEEIKEGIEGVLGEHADLTYFYMDTKADLAGGRKRRTRPMSFISVSSPME